MANTENNQAPHTTVNKTSGTGSGIIIGILAVVVIGFGFFFFSGGEVVDGSDDINVTVEGAGEAVEGAAEAATGN